MRLCLVEDLAVCALEPLTLTRPVHELLLGATTLASKIARALGVGPGPQRRCCLIRSHLVAAQRQRDPHTIVNERDWLARGPVVVANGRWVPPADFVRPGEFGPWVGLCEGQPACAWVGADAAVGLEPVADDHEQLPPYQQAEGGRFQSLDLERIGGLKEKSEKQYS